MIRIILFCLLGLLQSSVAFSVEPNLEQIKAALQKSFPGTQLDALRPSPVRGWYELVMGAQVLYVSDDGKHLFLGDLVEMDSRENLTERLRENIVVGMIKEMGEENMIVMGPKTPKRTITVFTDVDCPYCAKLHLDVPELTKKGVKVRYLMFPRSGAGSQTYKRSVAVWCAEDRVNAVGIAKAGGKLEMKSCPNPVEEHYRLGGRLNISGTPTIFLDNGKRIPGYVPPARLLSILNIKSEG
jgi:thiol:disulfide interchange protein DsbC